MFTNSFVCEVPLNPDVKKKIECPIDDDYDGTFEAPKVYYRGFDFPDSRGPIFNSGGDYIISKKGNYLVKYSTLSSCDVLLKNEDDWLTIHQANSLEVDADDIIDVRKVRNHYIEEYDFDKLLKRTYKITLDSCETFNVNDSLLGIPECFTEEYVDKQHS